MSHYNLQANVEDAAYLNPYPVAFQARDAMWSTTSLPEIVIPANDTRKSASILGAEAKSFQCHHKLTGRGGWHRESLHRIFRLAFDAFSLLFAEFEVEQDRHRLKRSPFWP